MAVSVTAFVMPLASLGMGCLTFSAASESLRTRKLSAHGC
jgi:hypothetical protein